MTHPADGRTPASDRDEIRGIVDGWIMWRDGGEWGRLAACWHPGGRMSTTRFDGLATDFVAQTRRAYAAGARVRHTQSGFWCELRGDRAFGVTGMSILQRGELDGMPIDVTCVGCFVDFFSYRNGRWALERRQPAYDWDRISPVDPGATLVLDVAALETFPKPYRHLALLQSRMGQTINKQLPEARGPSFEALMTEAQAWIASEASSNAAEPMAAPRRVIAAHNKEGRSEAAHDDAVGPGRTPVPGLRTRVIWATDARADYRTALADVDWPSGIAPPPSGSRFSMIDLDPGHRSAAMHRTDTLDYVICLSGQPDLLLEEGAVSLRPGDVAIQCGTNHGWSNPGTVPARLAVILIDGQPKRRDAIDGAGMAP